MTAARRTKVLHFIHNSARSSYLEAVADYTDRSRFDLAVASLGPAGPLQDAMSERHVPTFALDCRRRAQYPLGVLRLARTLRQKRIEIIQTHLFDASAVGLSAARLAGTPLAILNDHHSAEVVLHGKLLPMWADRVLTRWLPHRVVAPSSYMRKILIEEQGVPAERIEVIPYGLDLARWRAREGARERVRRELGIGDRIAFGAVGRLQWVKNYPALLSAFAAVARDRDDVCLVIAGEGPDRPHLEKLTSDLSIEGRVLFAGFRKDIADFLSAIDVLVHASLTECAVQVVPEAYLLGKPVVCTEVGGATELIDDGVNGYLVRRGSSDALADALRTMLGRREDWEEMGAKGRARARHNSAERILARTEAQVLRWLAERNRRGAPAA